MREGRARPRRCALAILVASLVVCLGPAAPAGAQAGAGVTADRRPIPAPVVPPPHYIRALEAGTRGPDGRPGPAYWQQWATYEIEARLEPDSGLVTGSERIRYENRSPDTLRTLVMHLYQNIHRAGTVRNEPQEITGGVDLDRVVVDGRRLHPAGSGPGPAYEVSGTLLGLRPADPLPPGGTAEIEVDWSFRMPQSGTGRVGWSDRELYFVGYWFPKMAVYDDLRGWDAEPFLGNAEFYDGFGDYRYELTVPTGWTVMGTGELENPDDVFAEGTLERLAAAAEADSTVVVADGDDRRARRITTAGEEGFLTYRFRADSVRDVAWTASNVQEWHATSARVPDRDGDGADDRVLIHSFWRPDRAPLWRDQARYAKHSVEHHSRYTGFAYPWPHMTSVEGADIIGGGMEFPMATVMGTYRGREPVELYNVTSHEIAHMWIPMVVGTNERRHAWIDEGATTFLEEQGRPDFWPEAEAHTPEFARYLGVARQRLEEPMMRHGDAYESGPSYVVASYAKPAVLLVTLRNLLGEETFQRAYRGFIEDWAYRHPTPWDLFNAFERETGRDLDWFWTSWLYETWTLDHAVAGVEARNGSAAVVVEDRGWAMLPARVRVTTGDGRTVEREVPVERWLEGETRATVEVPVEREAIERVEVDPDREFPDVNRENDTWTAGGGG